MLAPGEYLLVPPAIPAAVTSPTPLETPVLALAVGLHDQAARLVPPPAKAEEPESRSFLLILLRALGAIHT